MSRPPFLGGEAVTRRPAFDHGESETRLTLLHRLAERRRSIRGAMYAALDAALDDALTAESDEEFSTILSSTTQAKPTASPTQRAGALPGGPSAARPTNHRTGAGARLVRLPVLS